MAATAVQKDNTLGIVIAIGVLGLLGFTIYMLTRKSAAAQQMETVVWKPSQVPAPQTYDNLETVELVDVNPITLMPAKIIVHRNAKVTRDA